MTGSALGQRTVSFQKHSAKRLPGGVQRGNSVGVGPRFFSIGGFIGGFFFQAKGTSIRTNFREGYIDKDASDALLSDVPFGQFSLAMYLLTIFLAIYRLVSFP